MRAALKALLEEGREPDYPRTLCRMILLALGVNRIEANRISTLPLPQQAESSTRLVRRAPAVRRNALL